MVGFFVGVPGGTVGVCDGKAVGICDGTEDGYS